MTFLRHLLLHSLRPFIVTVLAILMLTATSAHVRESVIAKLQENGVQRFYETEAVHHGRTEVRLAQLKIGRKPAEELQLRGVQVSWPVERPDGRPADGPTSTRASPHQPRAPPIA